MNGEAATEKVSVNINTSTLSSIDLLVDNGYYSNRSDFVNQAVRETLRQHNRDIDRIVKANNEREDSGRMWFIGVCVLDQHDLVRLKMKQKILDDKKLRDSSAAADYESGLKADITGYGVLTIDKDCSEELLFDTVSSIKIRGRVYCSDSIKRHYGLK